MAICTFVWLNLDIDAKVLGFAWVMVGLLVYLLMRRGGAGQGLDSAKA